MLMAWLPPTFHQRDPLPLVPQMEYLAFGLGLEHSPHQSSEGATKNGGAFKAAVQVDQAQHQSIRITEAMPIPQHKLPHPGPSNVERRFAKTLICMRSCLRKHAAEAHTRSSPPLSPEPPGSRPSCLSHGPAVSCPSEAREPPDRSWRSSKGSLPSSGMFDRLD